MQGIFVEYGITVDDDVEEVEQNRQMYKNSYER